VLKVTAPLAFCSRISMICSCASLLPRTAAPRRTLRALRCLCVRLRDNSRFGRRPVREGVAVILAWRYPLQVVGTVVPLVAVPMVRNVASRAWPLEGFQHRQVNPVLARLAL
jgi:hypothetical protein